MQTRRLICEFLNVDYFFLFAIEVNMHCTNMVKLFCVSLRIHFFKKAPKKFDVIKLCL